MTNKETPIVKNISYSSEVLLSTVNDWELLPQSKYLLNYPTVYIINDKNKKDEFEVYVGETADIKNRTTQHLINDSKLKPYWSDFNKSPTSSMFVIGHPFFNKSLTLDIENKLMQYLTSVDNVVSLFNSRTNQQNEYYTSDKLDEIFTAIWSKLHKQNSKLFPIESIIKDSAIFKASPFHKLTNEQNEAKENILNKIQLAIHKETENQLIMVEGEAGSGKTVLMSSLFFELKQLKILKSDSSDSINIHLLVNHDQQLKVYRQIAQKLGLEKKGNTIINKPTSFILNNSPTDKVDVVIIDEAHLLLTQGKMSYKGEGHLKDIRERAKIVVAVFDEKQILSREQVWEYNTLNELMNESKEQNNHIFLKNQLRINGGIETINWIRKLIDTQTVENIPIDSKGYEIKVFDTPKELEKEIKIKAKNYNSGISRILATFDWPYNGQKSPVDELYWKVKIGDWEMPWNLQLRGERGQSKLSWAEQNHTINEVGSTFTIQGFDLNYAGVIIGPSVKFRNGEIIFDKTESKNIKATQNRTLSDKTKQNFAEDLLKNELNVLLTRGVNGLYLYAVDDELRQALKLAAKGEIKFGK
ncbi:DUF2075 domain-containing protein [Staphylococcus capitis]|uniref:DUF2075 domain-containing protein n=1 Tax=Staphylococcus capitis TaxID=29388 RepID=UPI00119CCC56